MSKSKYIEIAKTHFNNKKPLLALQTMQEALKEFPEDLTIKQNIIQLALKSNDIVIARLHLKDLIKKSPLSLNLLQLLEKLSDDFESKAACIESYFQVIEANHGTPDLHYNFALYLRSNQMSDLAETHFRQAIKYKISAAEEAWTNLGITLNDKHKPNESRAAYLTALSINKNYTPAILNMAGLEEELGNKNVANELYKRTLLVSPFHHLAFFRLAHLGADKQLSTLELSSEDFISNNKNNDLALEFIYYGIGKIKHTKKKYSDAATAYKLANKLSEKRCGSSPRKPIKENPIENEIRAQQQDTPTTETETEDPIFICGEFRSGTTLVNQILSSHTNFACLGELPYIGMISTENSIDNIRSEYFNLCHKNHDGIDRKIIIDKMPNNIRQYKFIKKHFHNAKFIFLDREPKDIALSLFMNMFAEEVNYANKIESALNTARSTRDLIYSINKTDPKNTLIVSYEELIRNQVEIVQNICDFLKIPYENNMLDFTISKNPAKTASVNQVRNPLNSESINSHKNYMELFDSDE